MLSFAFVIFPVIFFVHEPTTQLMLWTLIEFLSPLFSLTVAAYIGYLKGFFLNKKAA